MTHAEKDKLDIRWSELIKERDGHRCRHCGTTVKKLESAHIVGRSSFKTRWLLRNGLTLCFTCHAEYDQHRNNAESWLVNHIGKELWAELQWLSRPCNAGGNYFYEDIKKQLEEDFNGGE